MPGNMFTPPRNVLPPLIEYVGSPCLALTLLSKAIHLHFHYTYEPFTWKDAVFIPTIFAYDGIVCFLICSCLAYGRSRETNPSIAATTKDKPTTKHRMTTTSTELPLAARWLLLSFATGSLLAIGLSVANELAIYIFIGGLCSWPVVIEVFSRPSYLSIFWSQWMSSKQTWFMAAIPAGAWLYFVAFRCIVQQLGSRRLSRNFTKSNAIRLFSANLLCFAAQSFVRPWAAWILFCLWTYAWAVSISWLLDFLLSTPSAGSDTKDTPSNLLPVLALTTNHQKQPRAENKERPRLLLGVLLLSLWCAQPKSFNDISVTVPMSVIYSILGITEERCPVGKAWPKVSTTMRTDVLPCSGHVCDAQDYFELTNLTAHWDADPGFEMFSPQRQAEWASWASSIGDPESTTHPPSGYHFLFDKDKISNLDRPILPGLLQDAAGKSKSLADVKIRNVVLMLMESTPTHSFPLTPESPFYQRTMDSRVPNGVYADIEEVTPNAAQLFLAKSQPGDKEERRHGINIKGAETSSSYTLKSQVASHCGLSPLPMDFMREVVPDAHFYQPCLPHIFHALNRLQGDDQESKKQLGTSGNQSWNVLYAQPCDERWDRTMNVLEQIGFDLNGEVIVKSTMDKPDAPYPVPRSRRKTVNGEWFFPEDTLGPYFRDFWRASKSKNQHSFLSHITATTHYPWPLPSDWEMRHYGEDVESNTLLNAMAHQDSWLGQMIDIMREEAVLNETLVLLSSDHGIALQEGDLKQRLQPHNPHINNFAVPMLFYHPDIPFVEVPANATSLHILPTIIDLLLNTDSGMSRQQQDFLHKLLPSYEGQSLIRTLKFQPDSKDDSSPSAGHKKPLSFALPSPGRGHIIVTSPDPAVPWRLSMPLCHHGTYAATNVREDRNEDRPVRALDWSRLLRTVRKRWGEEAADWFEDARERAVIWTREVSRRWGVDQRSPPGEMVVRWIASS